MVWIHRSSANPTVNSNNGTDPLNLVDSSGWIEYLSDGANADVFAVPLFDVDRFIAPSVRIYEV